MNVAAFIAPIVWAAQRRSPLRRPLWGPSYRPRRPRETSPALTFTDELVESALRRD